MNILIKIFFQKIFFFNTIHCLVILPTGQAMAGQPQNVKCKSVYLTLRRQQTVQHLYFGQLPDIMLHYEDIAKFSWGCNGVNIPLNISINNPYRSINILMLPGVH